MGSTEAASHANFIICPTARRSEYEQVLRPGMALVIESNAVTADGMFGIFFGHTFIITDGEPECVDGYPWEMTVVR